jgi:hypothetical protein
MACRNGRKEIAVALMDRGTFIHVKDNVSLNNILTENDVLYIYLMNYCFSWDYIYTGRIFLLRLKMFYLSQFLIHGFYSV